MPLSSLENKGRKAQQEGRVGATKGADCFATPTMLMVSKNTICPRVRLDAPAFFRFNEEHFGLITLYERFSKNSASFTGLSMLTICSILSGSTPS